MYIPSRRNNQHRVLDVITLDKGRRHFWGDINGDYGFMQSEDRRQIRRLRQTKQKFSHRRVHTQEYQNPELMNTQQEGYQLYHDLANSQIRNSEAQGDNKRKLQITNNIQIHLPPIDKNKSVLVQANMEDNYRTQKLITQNRSKIKEETTKYEKPRVRTETGNYLQDSRKKLIRYTPTYICSLGNPMPTYKLYPNDTLQRL